MDIESFWEILNGPIGRIIGSGGIIAVLLYSTYTLVTIPPKKEYDPSRSVTKTDRFNSRRRCIKALCLVNFPLCIGGISLYYIIPNYINENSSGVITIESTGTILIILMVILAILSFISSLIIRNKVSRLK